jgi:hypothetical protein
MAMITSEAPVEARSDRADPLTPAGGYSDEQRPLTAYAGVAALYNLSFVLFLLAARAAGRPIPRRLSLGDVLLLSLATFKLSRLLSRDLVTSFLRAPFTTFRGLSGNGEVDEEPRGEGLQRAVGELLTCPFCLGAWVAAFLAYGLVLSPPLTRLVAGILATHALADFLQFGFADAARNAEKQQESPR